MRYCRSPWLDRRTPTSRTYISQRLRLHYAEWGDPDAPPLILLHGGRDHCRSWDWVADELRRSLARDRAGPARARRQQWSNDGDYIVAVYVYDFAQLIHQLKLAPVTIVAHSLGREHLAALHRTLSRQRAQRMSRSRGWVPAPKSAGGWRRCERMREWIDRCAIMPRRSQAAMPTLEEAYRAHAGSEQAPFGGTGPPPHDPRHQPERGRHLFSWKFDPLRAAVAAIRHDARGHRRLWERITCPVLLVGGTESWHPESGEGRPRRAFPERPGANVRGRRATGCTTTDWTASWIAWCRSSTFLDRSIVNRKWGQPPFSDGTQQVVA